MQISNNIKALTAIRQPRQLAGGQDDQKLVFIYPILIASTLNKYSELFRNFLAVDFVTQIKISNGLNITSSISKIGQIGIGDSAINPALEVRKSLALNNSFPITNNNLINNTFNKDAYEIHKKQEKLNKFLKFFKHQIQLNPRYSQYLPVVSTVMGDDDTDLIFPLIIGTKSFPIDIQLLFYLLSGSIILDLPLNTIGNLRSIINYIQNTGFEKINNILTFNKDDIYSKKSQLTSLKQTSGILRNISPLDNTDILFKLEQNKIGQLSASFAKVLDFKTWKVETNHVMADTDDLNSSTVPIIQTESQRRNFEAAMNSYNSYVSQLIIPILSGIELILGPTPTHINYHKAVKDYIDSITKNIGKTYIETSEHIRIKLSEMPPQVDSDGNPIYTINTNINEKYKNSEHKINDLKSFCQNNIELIDFVKETIYNDLLPHIKNLSIDPQAISEFTESVVNTSSKLTPIANTIESWLLNTIPDSENNLKTKLNEIKDLFINKTRDFFETGDQYALYDPNLNPQLFYNRHPNFSQLYCGLNQQANNPGNCPNILKQLMVVIEESIADILYFLYIWNFMSYICSYINEIDIDIKIQKKDVLDFPNYTLVLPINIFKFLYIFYTSNRIKTLMKSKSPSTNKELADAIFQTSNTFIPNAGVPKMIEILNDRLKIPNIIVLDEIANTVYYQFMYMQKSGKIKLNSLESYIKQQQDILLTDD